MNYSREQRNCFRHSEGQRYFTPDRCLSLLRVGHIIVAIFRGGR